MNIVLFEPQIPQNTGNIVRTCSVTGSSVTLVRPLGFSTSSRMLKRAGLDYWNEVPISEIDDLEVYLDKVTAPFYFFSSKSERSYTEINFRGDDHLIFGSETTGLPDWVFEKWPELFFTIPMKNDARCLNLSNAVAIVTYEALRQNRFEFS